MQRRRFTQIDSLEERLAEVAKRLREEAKLLKPGAAPDDLIRRARQAETGAHMSEWRAPPDFDRQNRNQLRRSRLVGCADHLTPGDQAQHRSPD